MMMMRRRRIWCFMPLSTVFKSYWDDGRMIMKGSVHTVMSWILPLAGLDLGPHDLTSEALILQQPRGLRPQRTTVLAGRELGRSDLQIQCFCHPKSIEFFWFLHENVCCGYSLEVPHWGTSNNYPEHLSSWRNKKMLCDNCFLSRAMESTTFRCTVDQPSLYRHSIQRQYSWLSLSRNPRDSTKHFEISILPHVRFAELRKNNWSNNPLNRLNL